MNDTSNPTPEPLTTFRDDPPKPKPEQPAAEPDKVAAGDAPEPLPTPEPAERRVKL